MGAEILGTYRVNQNDSFRFEKYNQDLIRFSPAEQVCRHRVAKLGRMMKDAGVPFDVYQGKKASDKQSHTWIEYTDYNGNRQVLDPMGRRDHASITRFAPLRINQGVADDEQAWVNVLKYIDKER